MRPCRRAHGRVANHPASGAAFNLPASPVAKSPIAAAADSYTPGIALLPVNWISAWVIAGVKPPKMAVARL